MGPDKGHKNDQRNGVLCHKERLRELEFSLNKRKLPGEFIVAFQYLKGVFKKDEDKPYSRACSNRMRGDSFKLKKGRCRLDTRKIFFTMRMVKHRHKLPRDVEMSHPWEHSRSGGMDL